MNVGTSMKGKHLALFIGLMIVGAAVVIGLLVGVIYWLTADMRDVTHQFLGSVRVGRYDLAYQLTTEQLRGTVAPAAFQAYVDGRVPNVRRSTSEWINGESGNGWSEYCVEAWLSGNGLNDDKVYVIVAKESGVWRVADVTTVELDLCESSP